ncbi:MAG: response regulator transcription factor [Saprospiraceae bacterium]|jgi:DNA-binding response OmpR family regulator|nr:response regulator transcription factor [Saprospiraceae bacterium]MBK7436874.1 response regulator transcription factor [Saprospiraceae bacterium]MBK8513085.1 response regulator transcription factor [Saprospiraceae bacterium]MBK9681305.1 response regulator transcription factor [Saprospiraceae bacterium]MBL0110924.1 response regulator transcription factor [Saprospiraceae bacterium]
MIRLLYVEDEPNLAKIVSETLSSRQFEVRLVTRGDHAVSAFTEFQPDICVLDVMLPHLDGYEVSKRIRLQDKNIPIIFLTAKNQTEDALDGFSSGGNDYIRKPFSMEELIVRIKNLLALVNKTPYPDSKQDFIPLGRYLFFQGRQELLLNEKTKRLSHRETELMSMLLENKHEIVLRKNILDKIWGDDSFFNSRNLDVYITKLRDYLKEDEQIQIITLKGVGYRLVD